MHISVHSPVLSKALLEGPSRATARGGGPGPTAATSSKGALCMSGTWPCPCPPACIQLAQGLLSWEQQFSLAPGLLATCPAVSDVPPPTTTLALFLAPWLDLASLPRSYLGPTVSVSFPISPISRCPSQNGRKIPSTCLSTGKGESKGGAQMELDPPTHVVLPLTAQAAAYVGHH